MRKLYTLENVEGVHWRDATSKAAKLSEPLAALLDTMLEPDTAKRASLEDVCASPWVNLPLPHKLQVGGAGCSLVRCCLKWCSVGEWSAWLL
jgi:hypothetical protein